MFPRAKKSFGQNFLADKTVVGKIAVAAELKKGECVLEIGPGTGALTEALLATGAAVTAVEADADLIPALRVLPLRRGGKEGLSVLDLIEGDILALRRSNRTLDGRLEEGKYKLIANIPYNITSPILEEFLAHAPRPSRLVLMLQKEVAERIMALPPDTSLLSVVCQQYAVLRRVASVPRGAFRPMPKVDSAVVALDVRFPLRGDEEQVIRLAKAGFSAPRKQLHGNLQGAGYGTSALLKKTLETLGLRPDARAESLSVDDWTRLYHALNTR